MTPEDLQQFTGTSQWYRNPLFRRMTYTDGVKYFAEQAGAYWFLDIVGTEFAPNITQEAPKWDYFAVITMTVKDSKAVITVDDGNMPDGIVFTTKHIEFTDCPEGVWKFYYTDDVLLLPSEY